MVAILKEGLKGLIDKHMGLFTYGKLGHSWERRRKQGYSH
jgi:hypothetical protein